MSAPPPDAPPETEPAGPPLHGFRGDRPAEGPFTHPRGLTVALSREAGARGTTIARKLGEVLGWQVFDQELLDYLLVDESGRAQLLADVPAGARAWADARLARLLRTRRVSDTVETTALARLVLTVAARGDAVIVGRGAGFLLPAASTLHVRVVAPVASRVNFLAQTLRLTREEAEAEARDRDDRRAKFLARALLREPAGATAYDLVVNSTRLGLEGAAQCIGWAVRIKQQFAEIGEPAGPAGADD
ncbi:MAG: cytidylate kinaselike family protein [Gemmataceae bacterium]|nr:cytidylate kinaselike family protein [Gemmataceae bacterium]